MPAVLVVLVLAIGQDVPPRDVPRAAGTTVVSGRITERGSDHPLSRIVVTLVKPNSSTRLEAVTDEDGRYHFTDVEPGAYALVAGANPHRSTYLPQRYGSDAPGVSRSDPPRPNLQLKAGETRAGLDFALTRALGIEGRVLDPWNTGRYVKSIRYAGNEIIDEPTTFKDSAEPAIEILVSNRGASVNGRVVDDSGNAVPGATVLLFEADRERRLWRLPPSTRSSRTGEFRAGPVRAGDYFIVALPPDVWPIQPGDSKRLQRLATVAERVTLSELDERTIDCVW